jgi:site-specific recombinase XerD
MKESTGFKTVKFEYFFKELDQFFQKESVTEPVITKSLIIKWRDGKVNESERTLYDKWSIISQFSRYLCHIGYHSYVPYMPKKNFNHGSYMPYIFTHEQMGALFQASNDLIMPFNNMASKMFVIPALIRLFYSTGMRRSEAISLINSDVDLQTDLILIRKTKNQQQRIIPISASLKVVLAQYIHYRNMMPLPNVDANEAPFFIAPNGTHLSKHTMSNWFRKLLQVCGIAYEGKGHGPRVHDLRHTYAVHSLMAQVKAGADIYCVLPILSVFLGHKTLSGTERYVRLTQDMYPEIIHMEESVSSYVFPSISLIKRADEK